MKRFLGRFLCLCLTACALVSTPGDSHAAALRARRSRAVAVAPSVLPSLVVPVDASERDRAVGEAARRALGNTPGSVVAMDPRTGRVLALVNPSYGLLQAYQPCSVFKIVVAIAGLTEKVITPDSMIGCSGGCWMWPGHGAIDLRRALAVSCNPYFERVGEKLGYEKVQQYAHLLGLGAPSGINLAGESAGRVPKAVRADQVGHLSSHAAGITTSAVQLAVLISATVNGGVIYQPQVAPAAGFVPKERWRLPPGTVLKGLADGFVSAVNEGSAITAFDPDVVVAGKTGSCSRVGWFASYAPADRPDIVLVVFLRWGNGHEAAAVAGHIYQELYKPSVLTPIAGGG
jgi:cell division protein FtsI/penicillin-binding protein 2